ncbi:MAG TPA: cysteine desulfurase [Candidatus Yaniella excrementavium]|nr:cysteine desulfurase [Candidatus Yaniella excrementavium]
MTAHPVYLDHNGTTPVAPEVAEAMWPYLTEHFGNPSSATPQGRHARQAVQQAREHVAALIDAHPDEITFTSGGTEANNLAIRGTARVAAQHSAVTSVVEHPATVEPISLLEQRGWTIHRLGVDSHGRIDPKAVPSGPLGLGTIILAQNEVGTIQPVAQFAQQVRSAGGVVHTDGAQAVGKIPVSVNDLHVDFLSIAGHKLYAPKGIGALYVRRGTLIAPVLLGAGQECGLRPGTENVANIVGLGVAAELAGNTLTAEAERQKRLTEMLWDQLKSTIPEVVRISPAEHCLPNTLMVALPDRIGSDLLDTIEDVSASTGSACHSGVHTPAETLLEMGIESNVALGALRLSIGRQTSQNDIQTVVTTLSNAVREQS